MRRGWHPLGLVKGSGPLKVWLINTGNDWKGCGCFRNTSFVWWSTVFHKVGPDTQRSGPVSQRKVFYHVSCCLEFSRNLLHLGGKGREEIPGYSCTSHPSSFLSITLSVCCSLRSFIFLSPHFSCFSCLSAARTLSRPEIHKQNCI